MLLFPAALLLLILMPSDALAWGAGIHLQLGSAVLSNLPALRPAIATTCSTATAGASA
jgi:hypothetical protein